MMSPNAFTQLPNFTRENVKHFVEAEKALIDTVTTRPFEHKPVRKTAHRKPRTIKVKTAHAAA